MAEEGLSSCPGNPWRGEALLAESVLGKHIVAVSSLFARAKLYEKSALFFHTAWR